LQAKLLRVIQEGTFERVGEETPRRSNVHLIAATNRDLEEEVYAGQFRADLYYRLNVFPIHVPPLRARLGDVQLLAEHFATDACARFGVPPKPIAAADIEALCAYRWPGNVRELQNVIERAILLAGDGPLELRQALPHARANSIAHVPADTSSASTYDELRAIERATVLQALEAANYRVSGPGGAAERLGIKPTTLAYRMQLLEIERPRRSAKHAQTR
jgi:transcriptional regulator with GAF, ATPase, and Fis domain